jgi:hypothetical protein
MKNKRGIGNIITMLMSVVAVLIILLLFALGSYFVKWTDGQKSGVNLMTECDVGINNIFVYMRNFGELVDARVEIANGGDIDSVLERYEKRRRGEYGNLKEELSEILKTEIEFSGRELEIEEAILVQFRAYDQLKNKENSKNSYLDYVLNQKGPGYIYKADRPSSDKFSWDDVDNLLYDSKDLLRKTQDALNTFSDKYMFEMPFGVVTEGEIKLEAMSFRKMQGFTDAVESSVDYDGKTYRISYRRKTEC